MLRAPLLHFLLLGGLFYAFQSIGSDVPEIPIVEVQRSAIEERIDVYRQQMGRAPSAEEARSIERQVVDEALWLQQAFSIGLHEVDSVVRQRLLLNMRFLEGESGESEASEADLLARAIELGMDRSDTVVQRRLIDRVQAILRAGVRAQPPDEATLLAHYEQTAERWREPPLVELSHVYLSRDRRGDATRADATVLLERVRAQALDAEAAIALGDPFLAGHRLRGASPNRIVARLGPDFAAGVAGADLRTWLGPIESAFGQHLVWIHDRVETRIPALDEIRTRVLEDWIEQESRRVLREHIDARRLQVEVRILEDDPASEGPMSREPAAG
ncbi:MAG: peptidylprolyl isomerase [bacterium]|nr:peptidylprolyl isomerase [bacterium]